jgi:hypothetical protein
MDIFGGYFNAIQATGRFYPWGNIFYCELGLGYGYHAYAHYDGERTTEKTNGVRITPAIGWKIDFGKPGGFFFNPMIDMPMLIVKSIYGYGVHFETTRTGRIGALGFGFAF